MFTCPFSKFGVVQQADDAAARLHLMVDLNINGDSREKIHEKKASYL